MDTLGRYRLMRRLGAGAFATVWLARDDDLDVDVAIKVMGDNWTTNSDVRERFLAEARLLRRIDSPRVMRVHDLGVHEEATGRRPYFVMDYADGGTLETYLTDPVTPTTALRLGAQTAYAVQVLHDHGVLHRDVKPSNILLTSRGGEAQRVVVADLGMAKALADASGLTVTAGTPAYMAPEQARGEGFDHRADVYAVAAVTYALLRGTPPFPGEAGLGSVIGRDPLSRPALLDPALELPTAVYRTLADALAYRPEDRPDSAQDLGLRLDELADRLEAGHGATDSIVMDLPRGAHDTAPVLEAVEFARPEMARPGETLAMRPMTMRPMTASAQPVSGRPAGHQPVSTGVAPPVEEAGGTGRGGVLALALLTFLVFAGSTLVTLWYLGR